MTHVSKEVLKNKLASGYEQVVKGGVYSHHKTPTSRYIVEKLVVLEATDEIAVLYSPLAEPDITFARPLSVWLEEVDGVPRFSLLERPKQ